MKSTHRIFRFAVAAAALVSASSLLQATTQGRTNTIKKSRIRHEGKEAGVRAAQRRHLWRIGRRRSHDGRLYAGGA